eukprot:gnl/Trimastix_PCT/4599.p1 GENE.gnl/Trimastix_PCT/4599~~gnl/Trimastix_PCT/4599.p1  ORF type:complete len:713 (-),score=166.34 gnl/Trimastix_PCT/4599:45-2183(-)
MNYGQKSPFHTPQTNQQGPLPPFPGVTGIPTSIPDASDTIQQQLAAARRSPPGRTPRDYHQLYLQAKEDVARLRQERNYYREAHAAASNQILSKDEVARDLDWENRCLEAKIQMLEAELQRRDHRLLEYEHRDQEMRERVPVSRPVNQAGLEVALARKESECEALNKTVAELRRQLQAAKNESSRRTASPVNQAPVTPTLEIKRQLAQRREVERQLAATKSQLGEEKRRAEDLERQVRVLQSHVRFSKEQESQRNTLASAHEDQVRSMTSQIEQLQGEVQRLETQKSQAVEEKDKLLAERAQSTTDHERFTQETLGQYQSTLSELETRLASTQECCAKELEQEKARTQEQMRLVQVRDETIRSLRSAEQEAQLLRQQAAQEKALLQQQDLQIQEQQKQCEQLASQLQESRSQYDCLREESVQRERTSSQLQTEHNQLQETFVSLQAQYQQLYTENGDMKAANIQLQTHKEQLQKTNRQLRGYVHRSQANTAVANLSSAFPIDSELVSMYETFLEDVVINLWNDCTDRLPFHVRVHDTPEVNAAMTISLCMQRAHEIVISRFQGYLAHIRDFMEADKPDCFKENCDALFPGEVLLAESMSAVDRELGVEWPRCPYRAAFEDMLRQFLALAWKIALLKPASLRLVFERHECEFNRRNHVVQCGQGPQVYFIAPRLDHISFDPASSAPATSGVSVRAYVVLGMQKATEYLPPGEH